MMGQAGRACRVRHWPVHLNAGEYPEQYEAITAHRRSVELSGGSMLMLGWLGLALGDAGSTDEARGVLTQLQSAIDRQVYVPPTCVAWTYLGLGDVDSTFAWLRRAVEECDRMMVCWTNSRPAIGPMPYFVRCNCGAVHAPVKAASFGQ
jgi:hypothetical protein